MGDRQSAKPQLAQVNSCYAIKSVGSAFRHCGFWPYQQPRPSVLYFRRVLLVGVQHSMSFAFSGVELYELVSNIIQSSPFRNIIPMSKVGRHVK